MKEVSEEEDMITYAQAYAERIQESTAIFYNEIRKNQWTYVDMGVLHRRVNLYRGPRHGVYRLTAQFSDLRADQLFHVLSDFDPSTRQRWADKSTGEDCECLQTYGHENTLSYGRITFRPADPYIKPHAISGVYYKRYNRETRVWHFIFRSADNPMIAPPSGRIQYFGIKGFAVQKLRDEQGNRNHCAVTMLWLIDEPVSPFFAQYEHSYCMSLCDQLLTAANVARNWANTYAMWRKTITRK